MKQNSASGEALWCVNLQMVLWAMLFDLAVRQAVVVLQGAPALPEVQGAP